MARIAGVDIPNDKHVISLTLCLYGIGLTSKKILALLESQKMFVYVILSDQEDAINEVKWIHQRDEGPLVLISESNV